MPRGGKAMLDNPARVRGYDRVSPCSEGELFEEIAAG